MSFDPYYEWLGIPKGERPPNHYRLLGIELFESNPKVIENAADQRMAHLRTKRGEQVDLATRLLNEISSAQGCLLSAEKKADYDRSLAPPPEAPAVATQTQAPIAVTVATETPNPATGQRNLALQWVVGGVLGVVCFFGVMFAFKLGPFATAAKNDDPDDPVTRIEQDKSGTKVRLKHGPKGIRKKRPKRKGKRKRRPRNKKRNTTPSTKQSQTNKRKSEATTQAASIGDAKGWTNLLHKIDLKQHVIRGDWQRVAAGIQSDSTRASAIRVPVLMPSSYSIRTTFTRQSGDEAVAVLLKVGDRYCNYNVSSWQGLVSGVDMVARRRGMQIAENRFPGKIKNGEKQELIVSVWVDKPHAVIEAHLNGQLYSHWEGEIAKLDLVRDWQRPVNTELSIGSWESPTTFHSLQIRTNTRPRPPVYSKMIGRPYGATYIDQQTADADLVGLQVALRGNQILALRPVYRIDAQKQFGKWFGYRQAAGRVELLETPDADGSVVGIRINTQGINVIGVQLETRSPGKTKEFTQWIGISPKGNKPKSLSAPRPIVGIHGRSGNMIHSLGLITKP